MMRWAAIVCMVVCAFSWGCNRKVEKKNESTVKLISLKPRIEGSVKASEAPQKTEWSFSAAPQIMPEKSPGTYGWEAASGISGFKIQNGKLTGKSTTPYPLVHFERTTGLDSFDTLHSIEIRCRVSGGSNLSIGFSGDEKFDANLTVGYIHDFPSDVPHTPILPGTEFHTYSLKTPDPTSARKIRHIALIPLDRAGETFEIESVRLIFRKEYLASIASGVSWQGLSGVYQETLVSRSPEHVTLDTQLPSHPWLDLSIGTIEDDPVEFQVSIAPKSGGKQDLILQRTLTRAHRWEPAPVELSGYAGQPVRLTFSVLSANSGRIGFWGSPVIRNHDSTSTDAGPARHVIVWWADTLRRDHLDVYGHNRETAPNIRNMAKQGALFQNCVSQATWTKVSTPAMMTSLYPITNGVREYTDRLPSSAVTLAEALDQAGFATISFCSNGFTSMFSNMHQGFQTVHDSSSLPDHHTAKTSRDYMDRLLPWLNSHRDAPFFVFFHAYDPHDPYEPYEPYNTLWSEADKKKEHEQQIASARKVIADPLMKYFGMPTRDELLKAKVDPAAFVSYEEGWYDGSIRGMDAEFGRLMEFLKTSGLDHNTLLVFMGDHGEEFLEHGRMFHGQTVYGELTNVPLIVWKPGSIAANTVVDNTVETIDVMPTILEYCGLKAPGGIQGHSFKELLSATPGSGAEAAVTWNHPAISEKAETHGNDAPPPHDTESYSIVSGNWKLIHNKLRHAEQPEYELYDFKQDPINLNNVASQHPDVVQKLAKELDAWYAQASAARLKPDSDAAVTLNQDELERMRSLGYIQ